MDVYFYELSPEKPGALVTTTGAIEALGLERLRGPLSRTSVSDACGSAPPVGRPFGNGASALLSKEFTSQNKTSANRL